MNADRILVGAAAAAYLKANPLTQHVQETCKGVRITVKPNLPTEVELEVIVSLIDLQISDRVKIEGADISDFTANLYSSRSHLMRAIREVSL